MVNERNGLFSTVEACVRSAPTVLARLGHCDHLALHSYFGILLSLGKAERVMDAGPK